MTAMTDYLETALLNHVLRNTAYTPPTTVYLALYTAAPTDVAATGTEVVGGSYARQPITFGAPTGGAGTTTNSASITFTNMPACTVVAVGITDASTAGNLLLRQTLGTSKTYLAGENITIAIGDLIAQFD